MISNNSIALLEQQKVVNDPTEVANSFNCYFATKNKYHGAPGPIDKDADVLALLQRDK